MFKSVLFSVHCCVYQVLIAVLFRVHCCDVVSQIYSNGYVTLGQSYNRRMPADFATVAWSKKWSSYYRGFALFAPMWTDANFQNGEVTYHIYDRTDTKVSETEKYRVKHALHLAKEDTVEYGGSSSINPSWVMVISWVDNTPRMYYSSYYEQVSVCIFNKILVVI